MYNSALGVIFGVKKYADELLKVVDRKGIQVNFKRNLIEVDAVNRQATFEVLEENRTETFPVSNLSLGSSDKPCFGSHCSLTLCMSHLLWGPWM